MRRARFIVARQGGTRAVGCVCFALIAASAALCAAAPLRTARLSYTSGAGAADCPDADVIRAGVTARLGYDPFDDRAELAVLATVNRNGRTLEARIEIAGGAGQTTERTLVSRESDCQELASAIELAISIAIDPLAGSRPRPAAPAPAPAPPPPPPQVIVVREVAPRPAPAPALAPSVPIHFQVRLGAIGAIGSAPAAAVGASVGAAVRRGSLSIGLEGRGDLPSTMGLYRGDTYAGQLQTSLLIGSLVPCASRGILEGCVLLSGGVMRASARDIVNPQQVSAPFLAVGARVGLDLPIGTIVSAGIHLDVLAPVTELILRISGEEVWTSPGISGALGMRVGARFP